MKGKKLVKIKEGAKISGVCNGLAEYFGTNVVYIRLLFVVLSLFWGGTPIILYFALAFILPEYDPDAVEFEEVNDDGVYTYSTNNDKNIEDEYDDSDRYERSDDRYVRKD